MFRLRNNTQKPDDEFITRFQRKFADLVPRRDTKDVPHGYLHTGAGDPTMSAKPMRNDMKLEGYGLMFSSERTPRDLQDLDLTQSWIDLQSMHPMSIAGQHPGFFTPNSGGMGAIFHNQAGDLHTPNLGLNMITPLSLSNPISQGQSNGNGQPTMNYVNWQYLGQHMPETNPCVQQQSFAPSALTHRDPYEPMDESVDSASLNGVPIDQPSTMSTYTDYSVAINPSYAEGENSFRYNVSLRAPTAMVKHPREVPVSYLNKGQAYNLLVADSNPPMMGSEPLQYRTFVRISFEEDEQRSKSAACWQLWKEGRGTSEAHQRGGKLLAVEYVDPLQGGDDQKHRHMQIERHPLMDSALLGPRTRRSVQRVTPPVSCTSTGYIEAVDIDPTYRPPAERPPKPIACFYVRFSGIDQQPNYYRAIYLNDRTVRDLMKKISEKRHIDPTRIMRIIHVNQNGLRIMVDDDMVRELPEGQDMIASIYEFPNLNGGGERAPGALMEIKLTY